MHQHGTFLWRRRIQGVPSNEVLKRSFYSMSLDLLTLASFVRPFNRLWVLIHVDIRCDVCKDPTSDLYEIQRRTHENRMS